LFVRGNLHRKLRTSAGGDHRGVCCFVRGNLHRKLRTSAGGDHRGVCYFVRGNLHRKLRTSVGGDHIVFFNVFEIHDNTNLLLLVYCLK
jgi:hypothetical protein